MKNTSDPKTTLPYTPKAVRGAKFPGHIRINRAQLKKLFSQPAFTFTGFIVGNNANPFHFFNGWHLACQVGSKNEKEMNETLNSFEYYLESELGNRAAIYLKKPHNVRKMAFVPIFAMLPSLL